MSTPPLPSTPAAGRQVVDAHTHLASTDYIPPEFIRGVAENIYTALAARGPAVAVGRIFERCLRSLDDPDGTAQLAEMDAAGVAHAVLLIADLTYVFPQGPCNLEEIYKRHLQVQRRHPDRFTVFGGVDPRWGSDGIDLFERAVRDWGFGGLKLYPPCGFSPSDERLFPLYEICAQHSLPVLLHIGPTSPALSFEFSSPLWLDLAARAFPGVNFILAHGAVHHIEESLMLCEYRPNVYMDLSGLQTKLAVTRSSPYYHHVFQRGLNHKVLFGSDWPLFRLQGSQRDFLADLLSLGGPLADLPAGDLAAIFSRNIGRLLGCRAAAAVAAAGS